MVQVSRKQMREHYKRLPITNVGGIAVNSVSGKYVKGVKRGVMRF